MMAWGRKYTACVSCQTIIWEHKRNGLCSKCYPLVKKREIIEKWDIKNKNTLISVSPIDNEIMEHLVRCGEVDVARKSLIRQINSRLEMFKRYNSPGQVNGYDIENLLEKIASITNNISEKKLFHSKACCYDEPFTNEQRQIIYKDLLFVLINRKLDLNIWRDLI